MVPESANILLFLLSELGEIHTELKLQKLVFQVQNEGRIAGGYSYFKHHYGPYSRELHIDMQTLINQDLVDKDVVFGLEHLYSKYRITNHGREYFEKFVRPTFNPRDIDRVIPILHKYSEMKPSALAETVYRQWRIEYPGEIDKEIAVLHNTVRTVLSFWETLYFPECPAISYYLSFLEYSQEGLEKVLPIPDTVVKSVLTDACKELVEKLGSIAEVCTTKGECPVAVAEEFCRNSDPTVHEIFSFIEDFCARNNILPKMLDRDFSELMTDDEYQRLKTAFQSERT